MSDYPQTGQKFRVGNDTYKYTFYAKSVRDIYGRGRFQRRKWSGPNEDGDYCRWVNEDPPAGQPWLLVKMIKDERGVLVETALDPNDNTPSDIGWPKREGVRS